MMMSYEDMEMIMIEKEKKLNSLDGEVDDYYQRVQEICAYYDEMLDSRGGYREDGD